MAAHLGRPVERHEDVHHARCRNVRCVNPDHLQVISTAEHRAHHGAARRLEVCPRHGTPYERRDRLGRPHCRKCEAQASVRYRRSHPDLHKQRPPLTEEQRLRRNERIRRDGRARQRKARQGSQSASAQGSHHL
jgi:hypothetical protein